MRKLTLLALAVGMTAILAACGGSSSSDLTGKNWQLTAITEKAPAFQGVVPAAEQSKYTVNFATDGTFTGSADCNQISGTYTTSGSNKIAITLGASTRAFCGDGSFDVLYIDALGKATSYAIANSELTLTLSDGSTLAFVVGVAAGSTPAPSAGASAAAATATPKPTAPPTAKPTAAPTAKPTSAPGATPAPPAGLLGKTWQLTAITEKTPAFQGVIPADQQANYTIAFKSDATFSAKADCNNAAGTYTTADPNAASGDLTLAPGPTTLMACADGSYGDLYLVGLGNVASYAVANSQLTLTLADGGTLSYK